MARTKGKRQAKSKASPVEATADPAVVEPKDNSLWLDSAAYKEVSADCNFSPAKMVSGWIRVRVKQGKGTNNDLDMEIRSSRAGLWDSNGGSDPEGENWVATIGAASFESLVALHATIGVMLQKARETGWHDVVPRQHGCDYREEGVEAA